MTTPPIYEIKGIYQSKSKPPPLPEPIPIFLKLEPSYSTLGDSPNSYELRVVDEDDHTLATIIELVKNQEGTFYVELKRIGTNTNLPLETDREGDIQSMYESCSDDRR